MYCKKCGNLLDNSDVVCKKCGEVVQSNIEQPVNNVNIEPVNQNVGLNEQVNNVNSQPVNQSVGLNEQVNNINAQSVNQNVGYNQMNNVQTSGNLVEDKAKNNNNIFIIIVVLFLVIIISLILVLLKDTLFSSKSGNATSVSTTTTTITTTTTKSNNNPEAVSNSNIGNYYGLEFRIPNGYSFEAMDDYFQLVNKTDKIIALCYIYKESRLNNVQDKLDEYRKKKKNQGVTVLSENDAEYNSKKWLLLEATDGSNNIIDGFTDFGENYLMEIAVYNFSSRTKDNIYSELSDMVSSATYNGTKNFSKNSEDESIREFKLNGINNSIDKSLIEE